MSVGILSVRGGFVGQASFLWITGGSVWGWMCLAIMGCLVVSHVSVILIIGAGMVCLLLGLFHLSVVSATCMVRFGSGWE